MIEKILQKNTYVYSVLTKIAGVSFGFVYSILFARYMGTEFNGTAAIILNKVTFFDAFLCMGIYQAYPYFKKQTHIDEQSEFYIHFVQMSFALGLVYSVIAIVCLVLIHAWDIKMVVILLPMAFFVRMYDYLVLIENPNRINTIHVILKLIDIIAIAIMLFVSKATISILAAFLIIKQIYYMLCSFFALKLKPKSFKPYFSRDIFKYISYGFVPMLTILMLTINYRIDTIMLDAYTNVSRSQIGIYALAVTLAEHIWLIPDALKDILLSKLANGKGSDEVAKVSRISVVILFVCFLGVAIVGKPVIEFIYGKDYVNSYPVMLIITSGGFGMIFYKMVYSFNVIHGKRFINFILLLNAAVINVILNAILIPMSGIFGASIASLISYLICGATFAVYFIRYTKQNLLSMLIVQKCDIINLKRLLKTD